MTSPEQGFSCSPPSPRFMPASTYGIAAPGVSFQTTHAGRASKLAAGRDLDGVQVDVSGQHPQVGLVFHQLRPKTTLELMARAVVLETLVQGVGGVQPLHELRKVGSRRADQEMEIVVEQGEGVEHDGRRIHPVGELAEEALTIVVRAKDLLPPVTAAGDVVECVGEVNAWRSYHDPNKISSPTSAVKARYQLKSDPDVTPIEAHSRPKLSAFSSPSPRKSLFVFTAQLGHLRRSGGNNPEEGDLSVGEFAAAGGDDGLADCGGLSPIGRLGLY